MEPSERTLKSELVYAGKFIKVREHDVILSSGKKTVRQIVEHPGACACVVLGPQDEVLLIRQYRKAAGKVLIEIPAGKLDPGETPETCVRREVGEETGISVTGLIKLCEFYPSPGFTDEKMRVFLARAGGKGPVRQMEDENISMEFTPFEEALSLIGQGKIEDAKSIIGLLLARGYRGQNPGIANPHGA